MKKVLITGASKGIGRAIAAKLSQYDYQVIGTSRAANAVIDPIPNVQYVSLDLNQSIDTSALLEQVGEIDILINNAGQSQIGSLEDTSIEDFKALFETNVFGLIQVCKTFIPSMRARGAGKIINIGSLTGKFPLPYYSAYCASKYAIEGLTQSLSNELIDFGIHVTLLDPNDIKTSITPKFICPEDSAYHKYASKVRNTVKQKMAKANDPNVIADTVVKILNSPNPNPIYNVGGNAKWLVFLKNLVSTSFLHRSIRKSYGLGGSDVG